jgi:hypothetical protein
LRRRSKRHTCSAEARDDTCIVEVRAASRALASKQPAHAYMKLV